VRDHAATDPRCESCVGTELNPERQLQLKDMLDTRRREEGDVVIEQHVDIAKSVEFSVCMLCNGKVLSLFFPFDDLIVLFVAPECVWCVYAHGSRESLVSRKDGTQN
jgi:hypothetical protein